MTIPGAPPTSFKAYPWNDPPRLPRTIYADTAPKAPATVPLQGSKTADVVIIGGGLTGMSAALHAAEAGLQTIVLEAFEIGWGGSGRSQGQVVPALQRELSDTEAAFGIERGHRLFEAVGRGPDVVFGLVERHGIDCNAKRHGVIVAAHSEEALSKVARRSEFWRERGEQLELFGPERAAELIGSNAYVGGVLDHRGGTIDPLGYTRGLAGAALRAGATIHTQTPALALRREGAKWHVTSPQGAIKAAWVLLCTDAHTGDLWPGLRKSVIPIRTHQLISKPLRQDVWRSILPEGQSMADTQRILVGLRTHPDCRVHCGGGSPVFGADVNTPYGRARTSLQRVFPQLRDLEFDYAWSGWLAMTPDKFPRFHECAEGLLAGFGYSGRGIVIGTLMGRELARRAAGARADEIVFPATPIKPLRIYPVRKPIVRSLIRYYRIRDGIDRRRSERQRRRGLNRGA